MGYRSNVKAVIVFDDGDDQNLKLKVLREKLKAAKVPGYDNGETLWSMGFEDCIDPLGQIRFTNDHVKWYADYEDIKAIEQVFEDVGEAGGYVFFLRVGEEGGDVEEKSWGEEPDDFDSPISLNQEVVWCA